MTGTPFQNNVQGITSDILPPITHLTTLPELYSLLKFIEQNDIGRELGSSAVFAESFNNIENDEMQVEFPFLRIPVVVGGGFDPLDRCDASIKYCSLICYGEEKTM